MNHKNTLLKIMVISFSIHIFAQDTSLNISLSQACSMGVENNLYVKNAKLELEKLHYQAKESRSNLYPHIEGYSIFNYYYAIPKMVLPGEIFGQTGPIPVELGTTYDWSSGFKATQILYNQCLVTSLKIANHMDSIGRLSLEQKKEEIVYQVSQVYYLCQATKKQIVHLKKSLSNADQLLEIAKLQNENGVLRKIDYSRIMVNKNNLLTQMENLDQLYATQRGLLKYLIGCESDTPVEPSDSFAYSPDKEPVERQDFNRRTEFRLLNGQMSLAFLKVKLYRQSHLPSLAAFCQHYYQGQRNEFDFFEGGGDTFFKTGLVGINFSLPIFDGFEKHSKIRQSEIELEQLQNTLKNTSEFFSKEFADAKRQYSNGLNAFHRQQENIKVAEELYCISLQGYRQQMVPLSDLLMSESGLIEARLSHINALLQLKNARLDLEKAEGGLLAFEQ